MMSISFTRQAQSGDLGLVDILRSKDDTYLVSSTYINEAKSLIHEEITASESMILLDDYDNVMVVSYGGAWSELLFMAKRGKITMQTKACLPSGSTQPSESTLAEQGSEMALLRKLLESNPKTMPSFFYAMGTLDTLKSKGLINHIQHDYWVGLFKPDLAE